MQRVLMIGAAMAAIAGVGAGASFSPTLAVDDQPRSSPALYVDQAHLVTEPVLRPASYPVIFSTSFDVTPPSYGAAEAAYVPAAPSYDPLFDESPRPAYGPEPAWARAALQAQNQGAFQATAHSAETEAADASASDAAALLEPSEPLALRTADAPGDLPLTPASH
jgi:hypothetical protein